MSKLVLKNILFGSMWKKIKVWKHQKKNCVQKYTFNKKRSEESSRNVCSADLEDNLGKEL